jgi:hypothetical protein
MHRFETLETYLKFDIDQQLFGNIVALMSKAPVPYELSAPVIQAFLAQTQDSWIQSLEYPKANPKPVPTVAEKVTQILNTPKRRGRPKGVKNKAKAVKAEPVQA